MGIYCRRKGIFSSKLEHHLTIPLEKMFAQEVPGASFMFIIYSKLKSFYVSSKFEDDVQGWYTDICSSVPKVHREKGVMLDTSQVIELRQSRANVSHCEDCGNSFGIFSSTHHCRSCGKLLCTECSRSKMRIPTIDEYSLFKVCYECAQELKKKRTYRISDRTVLRTETQVGEGTSSEKPSSK